MQDLKNPAIQNKLRPKNGVFGQTLISIEIKVKAAAQNDSGFLILKCYSISSFASRKTGTRHTPVKSLTYFLRKKRIANPINPNNAGSGVVVIGPRVSESALVLVALYALNLI